MRILFRVLAIIVSLAVAEPSWAAFTYVNKGGTGESTSDTSVAVALTGVTAGNLIVAWVKHEGASTTISVSDGTTTFDADTKNSLHPSGDVYGQFFYLTNANGGNKTYTATFGANRPFKCIIVFEYSVGGDAAFDTSNRNAAESGSPTTGNITSYDGNTLAVAGIGEYGAGSFAAPFRINGLDYDQLQQATSEERYAWAKTFTSTYTGQGTSGGTITTWVANIISFKELVAPTVTTSDATSVAVNTATGNGNVSSDGGSAITERGGCWGTSSNPAVGGNCDTTTGTTGSYTYDATGLQRNTLYYTRAYATNSVGTSYGDNKTFVTLAGPSSITTKQGIGVLSTMPGNGTVSSR